MEGKKSEFIATSVPNDGQKRKLTRYYLFSPFLRIYHWIMAITITILFGTGLVITTPMSLSGEFVSYNGWFLSLGFIRYLHFLCAFILTAALGLRIYGYIINKGDRLLPHMFNTKFWDDLAEVMMHYCLIKYSHKEFLRNPMARLSYLAIYVLIIIEVFTGYAMYFQMEPNSFMATLFGWQILFDGEMLLHVIHHLAAWAIFLLAAVHIYMVIRADFMEREGEASSMFSGTKVLAEVPDDIEDITDKHGRVIKG